MRGRYLVTGASSGIGRAVAERLLAEGCEVVGVSRRASQAVIRQPAFTAIDFDLADIYAIKGLVADLGTSQGAFDGAVLCAGQGLFSPLESLSLKQIEQHIQINLTSQIALAKALIPGMKTVGQGKLVFIGSEAALQGAKQGTAYCAAKFGLRGFTQALRAECSAAGMQVSLINPGMVDTPFFDDLHFRPAKGEENAISAETVADCVTWVLSAPSNTQIDEVDLSPRSKVLASQGVKS